MTPYVLEEDRLVAHRLDRFENIEHLKQNEMNGTYRAEDGSVQSVVLEASATRIEVLGCPVIPAAPGHHVLRLASSDPAEQQLHRISIVGWHVTSVCAFPVTVDHCSSAVDLYEDVVEFPDGHVEYINRRFDSVEEYCHCYGPVPPVEAPTYIPRATPLN